MRGSQCCACSPIWRIYVQCKHKNKLAEVHLPAIEKAVGQPGNGWVIEKPEEAPDQFLVMAQHSLHASSKDKAAMTLIRKAFALHEGNLSFCGLSTLNSDRPLYMMAGMKIETPRHHPPAITNVMLEVEQRVVQHGN